MPFEYRKFKRPGLILDSRILCDQYLNECMQQRFASLSDVVNKLKETEIQREFLLGNAPMQAQPTLQERLEPCHRIHMHFTKAVTIFISGVLAPSIASANEPVYAAGVRMPNGSPDSGEKNESDT